MKTSFCILLAVVLCTTSGFAADKTPAIPNVPASSLVEIGKIYNFGLASGNEVARVVKRLNATWIFIEATDGNSQRMLNLQTVIDITPYKPANP